MLYQFGFSSLGFLTDNANFPLIASGTTMIDVHIPAPWFYPELPGGPNQYFRYGPFLRERGVQIHVHTVQKPHHQETELEIRGIKVRRYEMPRDLPLQDELERLSLQAIASIGSKKTRKTCIQPLGITPQTVSVLSLLWKARFRGIAPVFHCMMVPVREPRPFPGNLKEAARLRMIFSPYRKLLMCSQGMGRAFTEIEGIPPKRIAVIPNGIDLSVFSPVSAERKEALRAELELPVDEPIVLYVGSVLARKGVEILVEAWETVLIRHPGARLVMVGSTGARPTIRDPEGQTELDCYQAGFFDQIEALSNPESIVFAGEVENVQDYYRAADIFAFASRREGLPSVVLEAMACALPCVLAPFIGLPDDGEEYGVAGEHFVKTTHEPAQMAKDILGLIENDEVRTTMGVDACEWIHETQEMGKAADRLAEVYHQIAT